ncbi:MAG: hypothetical protein AB8G22_07000 [Saprospiraceae bacterium]
MTDRLRKLNLLEEIAQLDEDDALIIEIDALIQKRKTATYGKNINPQSLEDTLRELEKGEADVAAGRLTDIDDVIKESENW